jgi:hypothetical protein
MKDGGKEKFAGNKTLPVPMGFILVNRLSIIQVYKKKGICVMRIFTCLNAGWRGGNC